MSIRNTLTRFGKIVKTVAEESTPYDVRPVLSRETPDLRVTIRGGPGEMFHINESYWIDKKLFTTIRVVGVPVFWCSRTNSTKREVIDGSIHETGRKDSGDLATVEHISDEFLESYYDRSRNPHTPSDCDETDGLPEREGGKICIPCAVSAIENGDASREDVSLPSLSWHHETNLRGILDYVENKGGDSRDSR